MKLIQFLEKWIAPLLVAAVLGIGGLFLRVEVMAYQVNELIVWKNEERAQTDDQLVEITVHVEMIRKDINRIIANFDGKENEIGIEWCMAGSASSGLILPTPDGQRSKAN